MNKRPLLRIYLMHLLLTAAMASSPALVSAQTPTPPDKPVFQLPSPPKKNNRFPDENTERRLGPVSLPAGPGVGLVVDNRTTGRITVRGWDRDVIEARATSARGDEVLVIARGEADGRKIFSLKADYANTEPETPTQALDLPPVDSDGPIQVHLEVNVPRQAELELIRVIRSNVEVSGMETPVMVMGHSSNVTLNNVSSVEVHTRTGKITIENARGISDVTSSTGPIKISNSRGAVRATSIAGSIEVRCVKGRTEVGNTLAPIELIGIDGDVEAIAANSDVRFTGPLSPDMRYFLKSMSGQVEMIIPADTRGFNATLTSYRGSVESAFTLDPKRGTQEAHTGGHRLSGRFGNGTSQITLDSFEGVVKLSKISPASIIPCP